MPRKKKTETEAAQPIVETLTTETEANTEPNTETPTESSTETVVETKEKVKKKTKKEELLERQKELLGKIEEVKTEDLKEKVKVEKADTLVPIEDYVKCSIHIGTKVITPHMRPFVYRRRADGIAVINTNAIDEKLKEAIKFLVKYDPKDFVIVCKREAGWRAIDIFSQLTGVRVFTKKYPAGIITNSALPNFFETEMIFVCDPWIDKNAMNDAKKTKKKVMAICDTNNYSFDVDVVLPGNNKSNKSLGLFFYILAREYMKAHKIDRKLPDLEDFVGEKLDQS